jgi:hypothetical protein
MNRSYLTPKWLIKSERRKRQMLLQASYRCKPRSQMIGQRLPKMARQEGNSFAVSSEVRVGQAGNFARPLAFRPHVEVPEGPYTFRSQTLAVAWGR